jgi:hypothetical protein
VFSHLLHSDSCILLGEFLAIIQLLFHFHQFALFLFILAIANPFSLFSDMVLLKKIFKRLSAENVLSGVKEVTGNVANNCKSILMLGRRLVR